MGCATLREEIFAKRNFCGRDFLGSLYEKAQKSLVALRSKGGVFNTTVGVAVAKAVQMSHSWTKSLFVTMGFVKRACTSIRQEIPKGARKEAELIFHYEITSLVGRFSIPPSLVYIYQPNSLRICPRLRPNNGYQELQACSLGWFLLQTTYYWHFWHNVILPNSYQCSQLMAGKLLRACEIQIP